MDEKKINRIAADLMFSVMNHTGSSKESWMEIYAAICAVKQIVERSPTVHLQNVTPEEGDQAEQVGKQLGTKIANGADNVTKNYRN